MKYLEIQKLSTEEVEQKIADEIELLRKNKFAHSISPIDNPSVIQKTRRLIARLKTSLNQRTAEPVSRTKSNKIETAK